jgi:hypothetical protein
VGSSRVVNGEDVAARDLRPGTGGHVGAGSCPPAVDLKSWGSSRFNSRRIFGICSSAAASPTAANSFALMNSAESKPVTSGSITNVRRNYTPALELLWREAMLKSIREIVAVGASPGAAIVVERRPFACRRTGARAGERKVRRPTPHPRLVHGTRLQGQMCLSIASASPAVAILAASSERTTAAHW